MNSHDNPQAVVCLANEGNEASLQLWKIYKVIRDDDAKSEGFLRIVDESGEDYLFPEENFAPIELPAKIKRPFERAVREQRQSTVAPRISAAVRRVSGSRAAKTTVAARVQRRKR
jgi:hypothetical protein